jgi:hypothetical protein
VKTPVFKRYLNPAQQPGDRGEQHADITLPLRGAGQLSFRTLPGEANNISFDWAFWSQVDVR